MRGPCQNSSCTFNATKTCVLGNPPDDCENRPLLDEENDKEEEGEKDADEGAVDGEDEDDASIADAGRVGIPVLTEPDDGLRSLPASRTLGVRRQHQWHRFEVVN